MCVAVAIGDHKGENWESQAPQDSQKLVLGKKEYTDMVNKHGYTCYPFKLTGI